MFTKYIYSVEFSGIVKLTLQQFLCRCHYSLFVPPPVSTCRSCVSQFSRQAFLVYSGLLGRDGRAGDGRDGAGPAFCSGAAAGAMAPAGGAGLTVSGKRQERELAKVVADRER